MIKNYNKITSMPVKHRKRKTVDTVEFRIAEPIFNGVVSVELESLNKRVIILIRVGADKLLANKEQG